MVQWLRLHAPNAGGLGLIPAQGARSHMLQLSIHMLQLKILHAATKILHTPQGRWKFLHAATETQHRFSLAAQTVKHLPTTRETRVQSLGQEDLLEKEMVTHSSILAWKIPSTEEPGRLQSTELQRFGHD